jgi:hypothetical protein
MNREFFIEYINNQLTTLISYGIVLTKLEGGAVENITILNQCRLCGNQFEMEQGQRKTLCDECRVKRQGELSGRPKKQNGT